MFMTAAQLRFAASLFFGIRLAPRALDWLIDAALATQHEFDSLGQEASELMGSPTLDDATRREFQTRRFRQQAVRAARDTRYYGQLFRSLDLDPQRLHFEEIARIPYTRKEAIREDPDAFVRAGSQPVFRITTIGTTGKPTSIAFSAYEMQIFVQLAALNLLNGELIATDDILQISTCTRAHLGNLCQAGAAAHLGALVHMPGQLEPAETLRLLAEHHTIPGKRDRVSILGTYPSYLGQLVEAGARLGYRPSDFGVRHIQTGGEIVTAGLKQRAEALFGPVTYSEGFSLTEPWPCGGTLCSEGHLHFEPSAGLLEVRALDGDDPAAPGELGTLVLTPFPPFRETTLLLRYDTEDVVRTMVGPLTCNLRHLPATSELLGKRRLAVYHGAGWTFPRDVLEALEAVTAVPLPARCGFWAVAGGVAVEVVTRDRSSATRRAIADSLEARGVPLQGLYLRPDRAGLQRPYPLRGDLRELTFDSPALASGRHAIHDGALPVLATTMTDHELPAASNRR